MIRQAKRRFEKEIARSAKSNPKAFWSYVRKQLKTKSGVAPLLENPNDKDSLKFDDIDKASHRKRRDIYLICRKELVPE